MAKTIKSFAHFIVALLANIFYGFPAKKLIVIGVTGTDGKTTTVNLIHNIIKISGKSVEMISTVNSPGLHTTTPNAFVLQKLLRKMVQRGTKYVIIEVTSHGIEQHRILGITFTAAVLTNITNEHLDYHKTFEKYLATKAKLFKNTNISVLNKDDPSYRSVSERTRNTVIFYSLVDKKADYLGKIESISTNGTGFKVLVDGQSHEFKTPLLGDYGVQNCLAAIAVTKELGFDWKGIEKGIRTLPQIPGRFEVLDLPKCPFTVVVDFASTPNALEKLLLLCKKIFKDRKIFLVFGCAGLRDTEKRPLMGEIAYKLANTAIITAEDPRTEKVENICQQICDGKSLTVIYDRKEAIKYALKNAKKGDVVLITGKGHEQSMCFGKTEYPWNDKEKIKEAWEELSRGRK